MGTGSEDGGWWPGDKRLDEVRKSYRAREGNERERDWRHEENASMMIHFGIGGDMAKRNCYPFMVREKKNL